MLAEFPLNSPAKILVAAGNGSLSIAGSIDNTKVVALINCSAFTVKDWGNETLATPTDTDNMNEESGVWFLDNSSGSAVSGLDLPTLPSGWKYEGWAVISGTPVSTGTFTNVDDFDENATTSSFKGNAGNGPAYPGEDYLQNAPSGLVFPTDLRGSTIVISVEPSPDNSPAPFTLKPLAHMVPSDAMTHSTIAMGTGPVASLSGTVTR